jgi:hypothetical protein
VPSAASGAPDCELPVAGVFDGTVMPGAAEDGAADDDGTDRLVVTGSPAVGVPPTCEHDETTTAVARARARAATGLRRDVGMVRTVQVAPV